MQQLSETNSCTRDFAPPEPEFVADFWDTNFERPNFGPEFLGRIIFPVSSSKRDPQKISLSRNSRLKIHLPKFNPEIWKNYSHCTSAGPFCWLLTNVKLRIAHVIPWKVLFSQRFFFGSRNPFKIAKTNFQGMLFLIALEWGLFTADRILEPAVANLSGNRSI